MEDVNGAEKLGHWGVITRTQNNKLAGKAMKTISVSVDDETHRLPKAPDKKGIEVGFYPQA